MRLLPSSAAYDLYSPRLAVIMLNICQYGIPRCGPWLLDVMVVMFWVYLGIAMFASAGLYLVLWSTQCVSLSQKSAPSSEHLTHLGCFHCTL